MRRPSYIRSVDGTTMSNRRRRWLALVFALVFGVRVVGGAARLAHAAEVPFAEQPAISTAIDRARGLVVADIDGDGDPDLVSGAPVDDIVSWHENTAGDGSAWTTHEIFTAADGVRQVFAADVDGDGDVDVLDASFDDGTIRWFENVDGSGSMWSDHTIATGVSGAFSVFAADIDGDGDLDAASGAYSGSEVAWHENTAGDGSAWSAHEVLTGSETSEVFAADIDGDGDLDLVSGAYFDNTVYWHENTAGDGSAWSRHTISTAAGYVYSVFAADIDGDGDLDVLAAASDTDSVAWFENTAGNGSAWSPRILATSPNGPETLLAADIDGDGDFDLALTSFYDDTVRWYRNETIHRSARFPASSVITGAADGASTVVAADIDGDGDDDAVMASAGDNTVAWYQNHGTGWSMHTIADDVGGASAVFAADVDDDGDLDVLATGATDNTVAWYENDGTSNFWSRHSIADGADGASSAFAVDLDADGDLDVLATSEVAGVLAWYENTTGTGLAWSPRTIDAAALGAAAVVAADLDGDGDPDALAASADDDTVAWHANQGGQFALATADAAPARAEEDATDALLDIELAHRGRTGDSDVELATLELAFADGGGTPLDSAQANALIETLSLYLDDGSGDFDAGADTEVATLADLALTAGVQTFTLPDDVAGLQTDVATEPTFFLAATWTADGSAAATDDLMVTHVTSASSTGHDASNDLPLLLELAADVTSGVVELNDPPVAGQDGPFTIDEDGGSVAPAASLLDNDTDEENDPLTAVLDTAPANAAAFTLDPDGTFSYSPELHFGGSDSFAYRADDGGATSDAVTVTIDVTPVADAPTLVVADASGFTDTPIPLSIAASLVDDDGSETLTIEVSGVPTGAVLSAGTDQGGGVWALVAADLSGLTLTPPPSDDSDFTLTVTAFATEGANNDQASTADTLQVTVAELIFADGFESGDTSAWSVAIPGSTPDPDVDE